MSFQPKKERHFGRGSKRCRRCGSHRGMIGRAGLNICRKCMREIAQDLGFRKFGTHGG